jgi:hypothetical protein
VFKKWQKRWKDAYVQQGTTSKVMVASRPKVSFDQMAAPIPEIMDGSLYYVLL